MEFKDQYAVDGLVLRQVDYIFDKWQYDVDEE
jgi:hypothetical protein